MNPESFLFNFRDSLSMKHSTEKKQLIVKLAKLGEQISSLSSRHKIKEFTYLIGFANMRNIALRDWIKRSFIYLHQG